MNSFDHYISYNTRMGVNSKLDKRKVIYFGELIYRSFVEDKYKINTFNEIKNIKPQDAYMIQKYFLSKIEKKFSTGIRGWKIGLTSSKLQEKFNFNSPCYGRICNNFIYYSPIKLNFSGMTRIIVENEVAITLKDDIPYEDIYFTPETIINYIKSFHSAIEIVDDKGAKPDQIDIGILISMNIFNRYIILGKPILANDLSDLKNLKTNLTLNGKIIAEGNTNNVMGNPINSLVWLANNVSLTGNLLKKNDIIITGTTLEPKWIKSNGKIKSEIENLGMSILEIE